METFAERVRRLRIAKGYTQTQLGERLGVVGHAVGAWELAISEPSAHRIPQLARSLGVSCDELLDGHRRVAPRQSQPVVVETFGQRLRRLRLKAGYQRCADLAAVVGVTAPAVSNWEVDAKQPQQHHQRAVAKMLDVPLHYLLYGEEDAHTARLHHAIRINAPRERLLALIGSGPDA